VSSSPVPRVLSIAGSDSGGGAGIQADLKAFARCGVHGMSAITAVTAQNTVAVTGIHQLPPAMIVAQVRAVAEDIGVDAVKIGMLGDTATIAAVAESLAATEPAPVVLDPVMVAESGAVLLDPDARASLIELLLPRAAVITPNLPEARMLAGASDATPARSLAEALLALGPRAVVVTGGHSDAASDVFCDGEGVTVIAGERYADGASHGSGCTHSSVLAAHLALGFAPVDAARAAKRIASEAVRDGLRSLGTGPGPVDVFGIERRAEMAPERSRPGARHLT
jgi:hydroxymethylpyrimidine/phosphomethylpyrimidine kinase